MEFQKHHQGKKESILREEGKSKKSSVGACAETQNYGDQIDSLEGQTGSKRVFKVVERWALILRNIA